MQGIIWKTKREISDKFRQAKVEISTPKNFPIKSKNLTLQL